MMTPQQFFDTWEGKGIDYDNRYSFQCVDVIRQYLQDVFNIPPYTAIPGVGGAHEIYRVAKDEYFDKIPLSSGEIPRTGDIIIWDKNMGKGLGHIAVVISAIRNTVEVFEQDGNTNSKARKMTYRSLKHVVGWIRCKKTILGQKEASHMVDVKSDVFEELVKKSTERDMFDKAGITVQKFEDLQKETRSKSEEISELSRQLKETKEQLTIKKQELSQEEESRQKDVEKIASELGTKAEMAEIIPAVKGLLDQEDEFKSLKKKYENLEGFYLDKINEKERLIKQLEERISQMEKTHSQEIKDLGEKHQLEIDRIKNDVSNALEDVKDLKEEPVNQPQKKNLFDRFLDLFWR